MIKIQEWSQKFDSEGKVWIYTLNKALSNDDSLNFSNEFGEFVKSWKDHQNSQWGEMTVFNNQVLLVATNNQPSGCSISSLRQWVTEFAAKKGLQIFTGQQLVFTNEESIILKSRQELDVDQLLEGTLWVNTGISSVKSLQNGEWLRVPKEIF